MKNLNLTAFLADLERFNIETFGPGEGILGVVDHLRQELEEVLKDPDDVTEWIDIIILAFDGARRRGFTPEQITAALVAKVEKNRNRTWPRWQDADPDKAINHIEELS